ncbi:hypothetical protein ABIB54_002807 [Frigoribacterium sp. UYMn621]
MDINAIPILSTHRAALSQCIENRGCEFSQIQLAEPHRLESEECVLAVAGRQHWRYSGGRAGLPDSVDVVDVDSHSKVDTFPNRCSCEHGFGSGGSRKNDFDTALDRLITMVRVCHIVRDPLLASIHE